MTERMNLRETSNELNDYLQASLELGVGDADALRSGVESALADALAQSKSWLNNPPRPLEAGPSDKARAEVLAARPSVSHSPLRLPERAVLRDKLKGALVCRAAGCTLGAIVEGWTVDRMREWAARTGETFPPVDYWGEAFTPRSVRYGASECGEYTRGGMRGVPVDDDMTYTMLGLIIAERFGVDFTTDDVARAWLDWLPVACTAEDVTLRNLKKGVGAETAGAIDNPYCEWIGADIRSDPWAYLAMGDPEKAARMAYTDAALSHRKEGVYGAMAMAAAQAAAFCAGSAEEAFGLALREIPERCGTADTIRWALETAPSLAGWEDARRRVDERFPHMHSVHTLNNLCLTIFALTLGKRDVTAVLGQAVAMGLDNDCTAASAGSVVGAIVGAGAVPEHWTRPFGDTIHTYLTGYEKFGIEDSVDRFLRLNG